MRREANVLRTVQAIGTGVVRLFRNAVGGVCDQRTGNWIRYGLCEGSSDLIGWQSVTITPEMVGRRVAVFVALECKSETGRVTPEQERFIAAVNLSGGIGAVVRSDTEARKALEHWRQG